MGRNGSTTPFQRKGALGFHCSAAIGFLFWGVNPLASFSDLGLFAATF